MLVKISCLWNITSGSLILEVWNNTPNVIHNEHSCGFWQDFHIHQLPSQELMFASLIVVDQCWRNQNTVFTAWSKKSFSYYILYYIHKGKPSSKKWWPPFCWSHPPPHYAFNPSGNYLLHVFLFTYSIKLYSNIRMKYWNITLYVVDNTHVDPKVQNVSCSALCDCGSLPPEM